MRCRPSSPSSAAAALLVWLLVAWGPGVARTEPRQPAALALDALPAQVRDTIRAAYAAATGRPHDADSAARLAMLLHAYEQHRAAADWYQRARRLDERSAALAYLCGAVQAELGEHAAAAASFRAALQLDADLLPARVRLAEALLESGDLEASELALTALVTGFPELAIAHFSLGRIAALRGRPQSAAEHFERAIALTPEFGAAHYALAIAYRDAGLADRAATHLATYRRLGSRRPWVPDPLIDHLRTLRRTARDLLAEAARLDGSGRLDDAIALQRQALDVDPTTAQAHVNLIALYGRTGRAAEAEAHYRAVVMLPDVPADAHYNYGVLLASQGREDEALLAFRRALANDPFHAAAHNNLAGLLARRQQYADAVVHYQQALANDPLHATARLNLGRVLLHLGRRQEAADVLAAALVRAERAGDAALAASIRRELRKATAKQ